MATTSTLSSLFDPLFCPEEPFIEELFEQPNEEESCHLEPNADSAELLSSLIAVEKKAHSFALSSLSPDDPYLYSARRDAVQWIRAASSQFGFNALTVLLAVDYLDRCFLCSTGLRLQQDKPWMKQLSAVACLALAAKVEETHVPFLLNLQIPAAEEVTGFVFESKTIRRMELLVLSTLSWRMTPVTALAFIQCILPNSKNSSAVEILRTCECILLSVLSDWRWVQFTPSVWAATAMLHAMGQHWDEMQHILDLLQVSKVLERVEDCHGLIVELVGGGVKKRKSCYSDPPSPSGVIRSSCFSSESSSCLDSCKSSPVSPDPEPPPCKRPNCPVT